MAGSDSRDRTPERRVRPASPPSRSSASRALHSTPRTFKTPAVGGAAFSAYDYCTRTPEPVTGRRGGGNGLVDDYGPCCSPGPNNSVKSSPGKSPHCLYSDRLIPSRAGTDLDHGWDLLQPNVNTQPNGGSSSTVTASPGGLENSFAYDQLLRGELLGLPPPSPPMSSIAAALGGGGSGGSGGGLGGSIWDVGPKSPDRSRGLFRYRCSPDAANDENLKPLKLRYAGAEEVAPHVLRKVPDKPLRVLSAPNLQDDFYMKCLSNSSTDILAVGLVHSVALWNARTSVAWRLGDLGPSSACTSVEWSPDSPLLALGFLTGEVQLWDAEVGRKVRTISGHGRRVAALAWHGKTLATGSRDHDILLRDPRASAPFHTRLQSHSQEVCGLSWSYDGQYLASGGNEGAVCVWAAAAAGASSSGAAASSSPPAAASPPSSSAASSSSSSAPGRPLHRFCETEAAVKALAWSPHQRCLLATGGGTADKCIRFWNTTTGSLISKLPTGSQVCNLAWSRNVDEIVSTHGYSGNEIVLWRYPTLQRVATLHGHTARPLHMTVSADGQTVITGAGDETLRFWSAFPSAASGGGRFGPSARTLGPAALLQTIR